MADHDVSAARHRRALRQHAALPGHPGGRDGGQGRGVPLCAGVPDTSGDVIRLGGRLVALLAVALAGAIATASAQQPPPPSFSLDLATTPAQDVTLTVAAPTTVPVRIIRNGAAVSGGTLDLGIFRNDEGVTLPVRFKLGAAGDSWVTHLDGVAFDQPVLPIDLQVPALPAGGKYTGLLILSAPGPTAGEAHTTPWRFIIGSASDVRPATLVLDQNAITLTASRAWCLLSWCIGGEAPTVTVHLRDKTGAWPIDGVVARLEPGLAAPGAGFDPKVHIVTHFNGAPDADIFATQLTSPRTIPAHGQATVTLAFQRLPVGDYTLPLRFTAANSADDDLQRLTVTLKLRSHVLGAILVLMLAAAMSFLATRVVSMLRQRAAFLQRLRGMRPAWLADEPPIMPVISLRAALRQAEELSRRHWMSGQNELDAKLAAAAVALDVLDQVRRVRDLISGGIQNQQVRRRAIWALGRITKKIGAGPLSDQDVADRKAELKALAAWVDGDQAQQGRRYWDDLKKEVVALCAGVGNANKPPMAHELCERLQEALKIQPTVLAGMNEVENNYGRLAILWELRQLDGPLADLAKLDKWPDASIEEVYDVVNRVWWIRLESMGSDQLAINNPHGDSVEQFEPVTFRVQTDDDELNRSYLVGNKLTWHWTITLKKCFWRRRNAPQEEVTSEPQIAVYAGEPGRLSAEVRVAYKGRERPSVVKQQNVVTIARSGDFRVWNFFETADLLATVVALIVSVISGVALYALAPSFGSAKDYLALFTWGASLDQGKNFLQSLVAYSSTTRPSG